MSKYFARLYLYQRCISIIESEETTVCLALRELMQLLPSVHPYSIRLWIQTLHQNPLHALMLDFACVK